MTGSKAPRKPKYVWVILVLGFALLCLSIYWRLFGLPSLDNPVQEVMTAAPMLLPLGLMAIFAWIIARGWRNYRNTGDEFDLWDVVKFSFALVMLIATIALSLYGI